MLEILKVPENPNKLRIVVDLDLVIADIYGPIAVVLRRELGVDILKILRERKVNSCVPYDHADWEEIRQIEGGPGLVHRMYFDQTEIYEQAKPLPGAVETLTRWHHDGYFISIVTARPEEKLKEVTMNWLVKNGLGFLTENTYFINRTYINGLLPDNEVADQKRQIIRILDPHIILEDSSTNLIPISCPGVMGKILIAYPHNEGNRAFPQVVVIHHWQEIAAIVQEASCWHYHIMSQNVDTSLRSV